MTAPGRLATAFAVAAVSVALPFARTPAEPAHPAPTVSFSAMGLSFRYPATWRHASFSRQLGANPNTGAKLHDREGFNTLYSIKVFVIMENANIRDRRACRLGWSSPALREGLVRLERPAFRSC